MDLVPHSSRGEVILETLPKQVSPSKRWSFTLNNYTDLDLKSLRSKVPDLCNYAIICKEIGESGTPHLQGYIEFKTKARPFNAFNNRKIHWEKSKGSREDNYNYCSKDGDFFYCLGCRKPPTTIKLENFYEWQLKLYNIFKEPPNWDCRNIYWFYSPEYGTGKTQFCKYMKVHMNAVIIEGEKKHMLAQVQNQVSDIYIVLLCKGDNIVSYRALEKIKDGLFSTHFGCDNNKDEARDAPHLLIMGNEPPDRRDEHYHPGKYKVYNLKTNQWEP